MKNMEKQKFQPLKGFRDFFAKDVQKREYTINIIKKTFKTFGFEPLETPALEYQEILLGKYGAEGDKLMYKFVDHGGRAVALRYDQTVPTARVLALYHQNLPMPWRRYQIQPVWRAENPQAGRYREFLQCDADIYGSDSPLADAEVIALANSLYKNLGFKDFEIYINDRRILFELMQYASIPQELQLPAISEIDKLDRKTKEEVFDALKSKGLSETMINHLFHHLEEEKPTQNLKQIMKFAVSLGVEENRLIFQSRLARGLDYYTGAIFEIKIKGYHAGSVLGGGRYDTLIGQLSGIQIPAVGFAVGFDRTIEAMEQFKLFPSKEARTGILVSVFNPELVEVSTMVVRNLREAGITAEIFPGEDVRLEKQLKYADKKDIKWLIVIGPSEANKNTVILKDLESGHQEDVGVKDLIEKLKSQKIH